MFIFVETKNKIYQLICITETNIFQFCMKPRIFYENHLALTEFPSRQHLRIALAILRPTHQYHVARVNAYKASCLIWEKAFFLLYLISVKWIKYTKHTLWNSLKFDLHSKIPLQLFADNQFENNSTSLKACVAKIIIYTKLQFVSNCINHLIKLKKYGI